MNWRLLRHAPWLDTRAAFVAGTPRNGTLLDLGSSDGETLRHMAELRPDLKLFAVDLAGAPANYPPCEFRVANLETDRLPWPDRSMTSITCMHLVEHLQSIQLLVAEIARLLAPGGRVYFETPHPKTTNLPSRTTNAAGAFTMNFFDDPTHVRVVPIAELAKLVQDCGLEVTGEGVSRNRLFAASYLVYQFCPASRRKYTAQAHWLGWSAWLSAHRPL